MPLILQRPPPLILNDRAWLKRVRHESGYTGSVVRRDAQIKKRILIGEDEPSIRESLARVLQSEVYDVESANTGEASISKFRARPCDLVLLDLNMPAKDGWAAFEGISRLRPWVPVIVITARPHQYPRAVGVGVDALMEKPLDWPLLLQCVRDLLAARFDIPNAVGRRA